MPRKMNTPIKVVGFTNVTGGVAAMRTKATVTIVNVSHVIAAQFISFVIAVRKAKRQNSGPL